MSIKTSPLFTSFLVKVASRCNLNCSYCYMYQHADQSWKKKPLTLSTQHQDLLAIRLRDYAKEKKLNRVLVIYHGGEPLIFGVDKLVNLSKNLRHHLSDVNCRVDFGIQTNGLLLNKKALKKFEKENISVSLSIDGPKEIHDEHRLDHKNKPSFDKVYKALLLLKKFPKVFSGCIAVINPNYEPKELFDFFDKNEIQEFNILLPDANYLSPPKWKDKHPSIYVDWLIKAFDCWFDKYPHIHCKFFESILMAILGQGGQSDALGLGDVSLLNIETDGTYHDLDVLKITEENYSDLGLRLEANPISAAETSEKINFHRKLLTKEGLSQRCLNCKHVDVCGGGSVPHRFNHNGYNNPTVYCEEMYKLLDHINDRFTHLVKTENMDQHKSYIENFDQNKMQTFWQSQSSNNLIQQLQEHLAQKNYSRLRTILKYAFDTFPEFQDVIMEIKSLTFKNLKKTLLHPPVFSWLRAFYGQSSQKPLTNVEGEELPADPSYFEFFLELLQKKRDLRQFVVQDKDPWYSYSLGKNIILNHSQEEFKQGLKNLNNALDIIKNYDHSLYKEMLIVSPHIQLIKDRKADPDKDVSFSDETLPGAIFIGVWKGNSLLSPYMVAASIIHEHLHQKLYLLQQRFELFPPQDTLIFSPWPNLLRPPVGAVHAVYVFTHVAHFWNKMLAENREREISEYELEITLKRLDQCINDIKNKVIFTETGQLFFNCLLQEYENLLKNSVLKKCLN